MHFATGLIAEQKSYVTAAAAYFFLLSVCFVLGYQVSKLCVLSGKLCIVRTDLGCKETWLLSVLTAVKPLITLVKHLRDYPHHW